jgi:hypothetical protein
MGDTMSRKNEEVVNQRTTNGQLFINEYSDGTIEVEHINGGSVQGNREDWIFCFQEMMNILRSGTR